MSVSNLMQANYDHLYGMFHHSLRQILAAIVGVLGIVGLSSSQLTPATTPYFNVTAITAVNRASVLQCWQLTTPMAPVSHDGALSDLNVFLGNMANSSCAIAPPRFNRGLHTAPRMQWVFFLSGLSHVTLPNTIPGPETEAWIQGGKYGTVFARDTSDVSDLGHYTDHPSDASTIVLQVVVEDNTEPEHTVLYNGPCKWPEMIGL